MSWSEGKVLTSLDLKAKAVRQGSCKVVLGFAFTAIVLILSVVAIFKPLSFSWPPPGASGSEVS